MLKLQITSSGLDSVYSTSAYVKYLSFSKRLLANFKDLYEEYLFVKEPKTFDWGWHMHDFIIGVRQVLWLCGVPSSEVAGF